MSIMKKVLSLLLLLAVVALGGLYWFGTRDDASTGPAAAAADTATLVERGRYLALAGNCMACHTSRGGKALAGGTPIPHAVRHGLRPEPHARRKNRHRRVDRG
jgi:mono/diheme cytochrome c family protein